MTFQQMMDQRGPKGADAGPPRAIVQRHCPAILDPAEDEREGDALEAVQCFVSLLLGAGIPKGQAELLPKKHSVTAAYTPTTLMADRLAIPF